MKKPVARHLHQLLEERQGRAAEPTARRQIAHRGHRALAGARPLLQVGVDGPPLMRRSRGDRGGG